MSADVIAALVALASAVAFAAATVAQQRAAARSDDAEARSAGFLRQLAGRAQWWGGLLLNTVGYALQALALGFGSLVLVQPVLVTALVFALPAGARLAGRRLSRSAWVWSFVLVAALSVFLVLVRPHGGSTDATPTGWAVVAAVGIPLTGGGLLLANRRSGLVRAVLLAAVVGVLAGVHAVLTESVVGGLEQGVAHLLTGGEFYALVVVGLLSLYLRQLAYQADGLHTSLPTMTVLEPVVAALLGSVLLHEQIRTGGAGLVAVYVSVLVMGCATVAVARRTALVITELKPRPTDRLGP